ncbi:MAG: ATP-binding protein [Thermoanaerobacteraceae bacterium]|jgi:sensor histidine kinase regulating citrate/malate metabolism|nr:ATP-binding protein [Thermoanaerobacteraceae bacterium]
MLKDISTELPRIEPAVRPGRTAQSKRFLLLLACAQLILLAAAFAQYLVYSPVHAESHKHVIILVCFAASIVFNVFIAGRMTKVSEKEALLAARAAMAEGFAGLAEAMQAQNRDFVRHVEEISRLIEKDRLEELSVYLERMAGKIAAFNDVLKIDNPVIGALLKAKATEADVRRIRLEVDVSASLAGLDAKALDLTRIIGNLINNAFDAVLPLEEQERLVKVDIRRAGPLLRIEVSNRGPVIDAETAARLFEPGYTTKGEGHSGLGLYTVKSLTEKLGGTVEVLPEENGTRFVVTLPSL